jgi:hypothetical protein
MKFLRLALVVALVFASAVLFPLRRARGAFGAAAAIPGFSNAPRVTLRRRPSVARPDMRRDVPAQSISEAGARQTYGKAPQTIGRRSRRVGGAQRLLADSASALTESGTKPTIARQSAIGERPFHAVEHHADERMVDSVGSVPSVQPLDTPVPPERPIAATQVVGETPKPPPKRLA